MAQAKKGDTVKVHYTGKLDDGTIFDSSVDREPLEFVVGDGKVITGFENGVNGMEVGEKKDVHIPSDDAYGPYRQELLLNYPLKQFPEGQKPELGQQLQMHSQDGHQIIVTIKEIQDEVVILDANPPLAGKDLNFEIELVEVK